MKKLVRNLFLLTIIFALSGCGNGNKLIAKMTGSSKKCVDGIQYIQFSSGVSVAYETNGRIKLCE